MQYSETKFHTTEVGDRNTAVNPAIGRGSRFQLINLNTIAQGSSDTTRNGRNIRYKRLHARLRVEGPGTTVYRIIFFLDHQSNGVNIVENTAASQDEIRQLLEEPAGWLYQNGGFSDKMTYAFQNLRYMRRFKILKDFYMLSQASPMYFTGGDLANSLLGEAQRIRSGGDVKTKVLNIPMNDVATYTEATGGPSEQASNALYCLILASNTGQDPANDGQSLNEDYYSAISGLVRVEYTDI